MTTIGKETLNNQKIYFICSGTSTNDIIKSINNGIVKETKSFYDLFFSKKENKKEIQEDEFAQLDELGVKEMYLCQQNTNVKKIIYNITKPHPRYIITSLDYNSIESATILYNEVIPLEIFPIPNISNNTNINDKKTFDRFKKKFGNYKINDHKKPIIEKTNINNYWNKKGKELNNYLNIKTTKAVINWVETYKKDISSLSTYSYYKFKRFFQEQCLMKYKDYGDIDPTNHDRDIYNFVFISDSKLIIDNLKEVKDIKYTKNVDIIERSSIWEIDLSVNFEYNTTSGIITKKIIKYNRFTKIYPTENNYSPLKYNNGDYQYKYNNINYRLFNSLNDIPINYIKDLYFYRYSKNKISSIKKILDKNEKNEQNNKNKKNNKNTTNIIVFENLK